MTTRVGVLLDRYQPGRSVRSIAGSAGLPTLALAEWLDTSARPAELVASDTMHGVAAAIGAPLSVVSRAFTGTWYDLNGWPWNHFSLGDRVLLLGPPDPVTGSRVGGYGTVTEVDPLDTLTIQGDDGTEHRRNPDSPGNVYHLMGGCGCSLPLR
jgi:hypothetical protein